MPESTFGTPAAPAQKPPQFLDDGIRLDVDVEVPVRDGTILRANVFRPVGGAPVPVLVTLGPYGKDIPFETFHPRAYALIEDRGPHVNWETPSPSWWVPRGYAVVRVDQRGTGTSDGMLELHGSQQGEDFYDVIEWAGVQQWANGRVGLLGVSYYAITQWQVAALRPPSLRAIVPWEGASDLYREWAYHGGMANDVWMKAWFDRQVVPNQSAGLGARDVLPGNVDHPAELLKHPFDDEWFSDRAIRLEDIEVPLLSAGNWGGAGLHLRGNIEGFLRAGSQHKWLSVHTGDHTTPFYETRSKELQRRFLDYWLRGVDNGLLDDPPVRIDVRRGNETFERREQAWPLPGTDWQTWHLDAANGGLGRDVPDRSARQPYCSPGGEARFVSSPFDEEVEITGPLSCRLFVSTDNLAANADLDVHVTVSELDSHGEEVLYDGSRYEPVSVGYGWLRATHRDLDPDRTEPWRPYHRHDRPMLVPSGDVVQLDVEIWPTSVVLRPGHRLAVIVGAQDRATSSFRHRERGDAGSEAFAGTHVVHTGPDYPSHLLLPVSPSDRRGSL